MLILPFPEPSARLLVPFSSSRPLCIIPLLAVACHHVLILLGTPHRWLVLDLFFFLETIWNKFLVFLFLGPHQVIMASSGPNSASSSSSESAGDRSPEGSVLVTPELSNRPPVRSFTGYEMAPEHPFVDISKALPAPTTEEVLHEQGIDDWDTLDDIPALKITLDDVESREYDTPNSQSFMMEVDDISCHESIKEKTKTPFHKWMKSLHRRAVNRRHTITTDGRSSMSSVLSVDDLRPKSRRHTMHRHSSSSSSYGFVATVKTATASLASASILARSRRNSMRSSRTQAQTDRSSRGSMSGVRFSEDSTCLDQPMVVDKATIERSLQRRRILEELITTEEGYIGDVRFLMNVSISSVSVSTVRD